MKVPRALLLTLTVVVVLLPFAFSRMAESQPPPMEAPTGFDDLTNGLVNQTTHDADRTVFEQARTLADGLGPAYNRTSCVDCHTTPVTGGVSAVTNLLAGSNISGSFVSRLIHDNAICPAAQDPPPSPTEITTRRLTVNLLGDGYVEAISCNVCHVASITTAPPGTVMHQGTYVVSTALGSKIIHPYSDFLLHDVGTGDGFGPSSVRLKMRTAPLWGLRTHPVFLHDGSALTLMDAIQRHAGEAAVVTTNFNSLSVNQKRQVITFLRSL